MVANIVGKLADITFDNQDAIVQEECITSTIFEHKTAALGDASDEVAEADFIIFKLLQVGTLGRQQPQKKRSAQFVRKHRH